MIAESSKYFWWIGTLKRYVWQTFWWIILSAIVFLVPFLRVWWWVFIPIILSIELRNLYLWWVRWDYGLGSSQWITLRIIPQKEVEIPLKAMEDVFVVLYSTLFDTINWRERYFEGAYYPWMSWEIVSIEGDLHFYVHLKKEHKTLLESALYSYFPELEIYETQDYAKKVPQTAPDEEWDVYGEDYVLGKPDFYPIKTYEKFFEPQGEKISAEEKRIDPLASLLEGMSRLGPGEQVWIQFIITALVDDSDYKKSAEGVINKITKRPVKKKKGIIDGIMWTINELLSPVVQPVSKDVKVKHIKDEEGDREMVLTPGERGIVLEIEDKVKKEAFKSTIRGIYIAKRENWNPSNKRIPRAYFSHFQSWGNHLRYSVLTRPKTHYVMRKRIPFLRKRKILRNYILRFAPHFPDIDKETNVLNTEELATLIHFPFKITGLAFPTVERVEHKKGGPPPNLPVAEE